jgi:hypothetical protein
MKSVKLGKFGPSLAALTLALCVLPNVSWSTHMVGELVSGTVTAAPAGGQIEVSHHTYHVKANSPADKVFRNFSAGQTVDMVLDGPANSVKSEVVSIMVHSGT